MCHAASGDVSVLLSLRQVREEEQAVVRDLMSMWDELVWKAKETDAKLCITKLKFTKVSAPTASSSVFFSAVFGCL